MMLQRVDGRKVYVIVLHGDPTTLLPIKGGWNPRAWPYAKALDTAIREGTVPGPGKYGIEINKTENTWAIYQINE